MSWLMLFRETAPVYNENNIKPINTKCKLLIVEASGIYSSPKVVVLRIREVPGSNLGQQTGYLH
jgi:hypothetical protein